MSARAQPTCDKTTQTNCARARAPPVSGRSVAVPSFLAAARHGHLEVVVHAAVDHATHAHATTHLTCYYTSTPTVARVIHTLSSHASLHRHAGIVISGDTGRHSGSCVDHHAAAYIAGRMAYLI